MNQSELVVNVDGREAIPVRAIPYVTGWEISPDEAAPFKRSKTWMRTIFTAGRRSGFYCTPKLWMMMLVMRQGSVCVYDDHCRAG